MAFTQSSTASSQAKLCKLVVAVALALTLAWAGCASSMHGAAMVLAAAANTSAAPTDTDVAEDPVGNRAASVSPFLFSLCGTLSGINTSQKSGPQNGQTPSNAPIKDGCPICTLFGHAIGTLIYLSALILCIGYVARRSLPLREIAAVQAIWRNGFSSRAPPLYA